MNTESSKVIWKYAMALSYKGTRYCGWQKQKGSGALGDPSIQATIEEMLKQMTGEEATVVGSGRTDSGVHAVGQIAHFVMRQKQWPADILRKGLNSLLPRDIRIIWVKPVPIEFHAQRSAEKKQYSYYFQQGPTSLPHLEPFSWWISKELDREAMHQAVTTLIGQHDFKPFQSTGAKPGPTVREILEAEVKLEPLSFPGGRFEEFGMVRVRLMGTGFLKQMVRGISGTLLQIGEGRRPASDMKAILESGDRSSVGPTAPGRALWLEKVWYRGDLGLN